MIEVYGYLGEPPEPVRRAAAAAGLVVAGTRALDALAVQAERRVVLGRVAPAIERLLAYEAAGAPDGPALVLASGDPLFYGVVRRFRAAGLDCRVHPGVSSIAAAFAAVGLPWDDAQVVSAHGHGLEPALAAARALPKVAVLTAPGHGVREIAAGLADVARWYVVAERLGESDERVRVLAGAAAREVEDVGEPNVVLVLAADPRTREGLGAPTPYVGGPRPVAGSPGSVRPHLSAAAAQVLGRYVPTLGDVVWTAGDVAAEVAAWCARTGAAVVDLGTLGARTPDAIPAHLGDPSLVVLTDPRRLAGCFAAHRPAVAALLSDEAGADVAAAAVDAAPLPDDARVTVAHLALTGEGGAAESAYLTIIETAEDATAESAAHGGREDA